MILNSCGVYHGRRKDRYRNGLNRPKKKWNIKVTLEDFICDDVRNEDFMKDFVLLGLNT